MNLKNRLLAGCRLYVIVDTEVVKRQNVPQVVLSCIRGGADIIQLRDKTGSAHQILNTIYKIIPLFSGTHIPLIINDRIDILLATGIDGVHLGEDDMPVDIARKIVGEGKIIGFSADTLKKAEAALKKGADYLGVGPAFPTPTKPGEKPINWSVYRELNRYIKAPYFAIGGITSRNVENLLDIGVQRVCVIRAICVSDSPKKATTRMRNIVNDGCDPKLKAKPSGVELSPKSEIRNPNIEIRNKSVKKSGDLVN